MKASIRHFTGPLLGLAVVFALAVPFEILVICSGGEPSRNSMHLYSAAFSYLVAWGVEQDRKIKGVSSPFEFSAFMFFLWWGLLPYYLYRTRRWRGLGIAAGVFLVSLIPGIAAIITCIMTA